MSRHAPQYMKDVTGRRLYVGMEVRALRRSARTGTVYDFTGYIARFRQGADGSEALIQKYGSTRSQWLPGGLIEAPEPDASILEGVLMSV